MVQENHVAPVATVRCYVKNTGGAFEGRWLGMGVSHLCEHLIAGGSTTNRTEDEIEKIIDTFGGATNAYTSSDMTAYFIDCPAKHVMTCVDLIADQMRNAKFEPSEFQREYSVVQRELADGEVNRQRVGWKMLSESVYAVSPARTPTIGYLDVFRAVTRQDCLDFYRDRYVPNNQVFVVVGDIKTEDVLAQVAKAFAGAPRGRETYLPMTNEPEQLSPREVFREMDGATFDVVLAWPTVELSNPDLYALDVASYILTEGDSSRLVRSLKYDKQLVLSISSASHTPHYVNGLFAVMASARPETVEQATAEILRGVERLKNEPVDPVELAKAKKQKAAELVFGQQTVQQTADSLGHSYLSTDDPLFDRKYVENIQKVTAEQIRDVARRYFLPDRLNHVVIAPPGGAPKKAETKSAAVEGEIRVVRLPNGVRVLLKRQTNLPLVNVQAFVLGGSLVDTPETAGRAAMVGAMLDKGTAEMTAEQIADYFDSIGGQFGAAAGRNTLFANATVLRDDFPKAASILAQCFTKPTFPDEQFQKVKQLALGAILRRADNPQQQIMELFADSLPAASPYHLVQGGKTETVQRLTAEDLRAYHAKYFVAENMIVTVFGDVEPDAALAVVQEKFGQVPSKGKLEPIKFDYPNAVAENVVRHQQINKPTGMVMIGYPDASIFDKEDYAALTVLDAIMSGYSYPGGWLHNELRGEGLVYYVHASQLTGPAPGYFTFIAQTRPDKVAEVVERIKKNVVRAKEGKISPEEFRTAIEMITSLHAQENTTIGEQAQQAAVDDLYGLGYDYDKSFDARIEAVKLDDVVRVAKKYLDKCVEVTASP
jgi:zinc protease